MSSPTKKTPQKREVQPRQRTPIRTNLVTRAVTIQSRGKVGETPEDKKQERETRKAEDALVRRRGTPRRKKIEEDKESEEDKQDGESVQTSESEAETVDAVVKVLVEESQETASSVETPTPLNRKDEPPTTIKVDKITESKEEDTVRVNRDTTTQPIDTPRIKKEDEVKQKEEELVSIYNKLWEAENQQREKIQERERRRRVKASRKIDQEYERLMSDLYSNKSSTTSSTSVLEGYSNVKAEVESDDEDSEGRISKLEKELSKVRTSLDEKEKIISKLQKTPNDALQNPAVVQAVTQLEEKRRHEQQTFMDGRKELEDRLRKLQQENEKSAAELAAARQRSEKFALERKEWERILEERRKNLESKELALGEAVSAGVRKKLQELKEQRRNQGSHAQEQEPVPVADNGHENDVSQENDNLQEPDGEQNPELPEENEYLVEENHERNAEHVPTQLDNSTDTDSPEAENSPDRVFQTGRKRVRIEDDEDGGQKFMEVDPEDAASYDIEKKETIPEGEEEEDAEDVAHTPTLFRRVIKPYAKIAGVLAVTAISLPLVQYAHEISQYLPTATGL